MRTKGKKSDVDESFYVHPSAIVDPGCTIGSGSKIWHFCHLMEGCHIGRDCVLGQNVFVASQVMVADRVKIQNNVSVYQGVTLSEEVFVGPSVVFTNVRTPRASLCRNTELGRNETQVERGVTIGANATIVCGVRLGEYCFVGAGSVVTDDVCAQALVVGNPARQVGWACRCGVKLHPTPDGYACGDCGLVYPDLGPCHSKNKCV